MGHYNKKITVKLQIYKCNATVNFIKFYFLLGDKKNKIYQKFNNSFKENLVSWYFCKKDTYKTYLRVINNNLFKIIKLLLKTKLKK